jgi:hypothetical protein
MIACPAGPVDSPRVALRVGIRVQFWQGSPDGACGHFLSSPLGEFRAWYARQLEEWPGECEPRLLPIIDDIIARGVAALHAESPEIAWLIDRVMDEFYGSYYNSARPELLVEADPSCLYERHYSEVRGEIDRRPGTGAVRLWDYLLSGRAIGRPQETFPYRSEDDVYRLGYWTHEEVAALREPLSRWRATVRRFETRYPAADMAARAIDAVILEGLGLITTVA